MAVERDHFRLLDLQPEPPIGDDEPTAEVVVQLPPGDEPEGDTSAASRDGDGPAEGEDPATAGRAEDAFEPGRILCGRYELERVVGRGGFCVVLGARDLRRQAAGDASARVAIKALRPELRDDEGARHRLMAEFRQLQQLSHPNIVRVYDLDRHGEDWFLVMELLEGVSLAGLIRHCEGGRVPRSQALAIVQACADALGWAHGRGVVHGDVKPGNVFLTRDEGVRLLDFGTASPREEGEAPAGAAPVGFATPAYASPQVLQGRPPAVADDLYSLACVAFELLSGVHPFDRLDAREAWASEMHPRETPELGPGVRAALERGLSFDRDRRPSDVAAFVGQLDAADAGMDEALPLAAGGVTPRGHRGRWGSGWPVAAIALAGLVAVVLFFGGESGRGSGATAAPGESTSGPPQSMAGAQGEAMPVVEDPSAAVTEARPATGAQIARGGGPAPEPLGAPASTTARAVQQVEFGSTPVLVSRSAPAAAIRVRRSDGSAGRALVTWRIEEGSARSGRDFSGPLSGTLVLADGQEAGTLFVPLLDAGGATDDRNFSVEIARVRGPARAGENTRVDVTLRSFIRDEPRSLAARD